jgi:bifunctional polynucleotide phosphatase/kinase
MIDSWKDSTLVKSKTNKRYSYEASDWIWWDRRVPSKLRELHKDGYTVAIISNQGGISLGSDPKLPAAYKKRHVQFKEKATGVFDQLNIPLNLYAATKHDIYRKPRPGMWTALLEDHGLSADIIDMQASVFVGDAAGRVKNSHNVADFSCCDRYAFSFTFFLGH